MFVNTFPGLGQALAGVGRGRGGPGRGRTQVAVVEPSRRSNGPLVAVTQRYPWLGEVKSPDSCDPDSPVRRHSESKR